MVINFLVTHYHNSVEVKEFVHNLHNYVDSDSSFRFNIIICDNSLNILQFDSLSHNVHIYIYTAGINLGYLGGCLFGYTEYSKTNDSMDNCRFVICNTDIEFYDDFFEKIKSVVFDENLIIAPDVHLSLKGENQNPFFLNRVSKIYMYFNYVRFSSLILHNICLKIKKFMSFVFVPRIYDSYRFVDKQIYAAHGSVIITSKKVIDHLSGVELVDAFMFHEEIFIAEECLHNGFNIVYCPSLKVIHNENATTSKLKMLDKLRMRRKSTRALIEKYF